MKLYNTLSKKKEKFTSSGKTVGLYACGPTVYHFAHIGNLRSYIFEDVLKRVLLFNDFKVKHVMNITDVGHLTGDNDEGEDKMLKGAKREKKTVYEIADFYTSAFKKDLEKLNVISPNIWCKATDHIKEQIEMIKKLEKNGFTYVVGCNVYFDTSKLKDYGKLFGLDKSAKLKQRVKLDKNKKNPHDFVLWFTKSKFQDQEMKWSSPWGIGYPGWHIECSAMASKYLGSQIDIHCGGIDHIQVHHTNEVAQSEAALGVKRWVKYWLHNEFLVLSKGERMAKSGDNFLTLTKLEENGFDPLDYRYFCLGTHYRNPLMYSNLAMGSARTARKKLFEKVLELKNSAHGKDNLASRKKYLIRFTKEVNDDLNTAKTLATMWEVLNLDLSGHDKLFLLLEFDKVFGFNLGSIKADQIPARVVKLANERLTARHGKDWKKSDELRDEIFALGYIIGDTKEGYELKRK